MGKSKLDNNNQGFDYFTKKTIFLMKKIELIYDDIELWFMEGIILNKNQLDKLITKVENKCIKYVKKSNFKYRLEKRALEEEGDLEEKYRYYYNYVNALVKVLSDIAEDKNNGELLNNELDSFKNFINVKVQDVF